MTGRSVILNADAYDACLGRTVRVMDVMRQCPTDRLRSTTVSMIVIKKNFGIAKLRRMDCLIAFNFGLTKLCAKIPILIYSFVKTKLCQENFH